MSFDNSKTSTCIDLLTLVLIGVAELVTATRQLPNRGWFHYMMTSSNGIVSRLLVLCEGKRRASVIFDLRLNKRLSKQSRRRWFETPSRSLWCHCSGSVLRWIWLRRKNYYRYLHTQLEVQLFFIVGRTIRFHTRTTRTSRWHSRQIRAACTG